MGEELVVVAYVDWFTLISSFASLSLLKPITTERAFAVLLLAVEVLPTLILP